MDVSTEHIFVDEDGFPRTRNRRVKVRTIALVFIDGGDTAEEIAEHYGITVADVHAALAYYFDHKDEYDAIDRRQEALLKQYGQSSEEVLNRMRARLKNQDTQP